MSKILIVGNVIKDVYLALDERYNNLEQDRQATWLDIHLNGSSYPFFDRSNIFSGAAIALSILTDFGISASIIGNDIRFTNNKVVMSKRPDDYRYVIYHDDKGANFSPTKYRPTKWIEPQERPDWILIDYSANLSVQTVEQINSYLLRNPNTRLAFFAPSKLDSHSRLLLERAEIVFTKQPGPLPVNSPKQVCLITDDSIQMDHHIQIWHIDSLEIITRRTAYSVIATTVLAALIKGRSIPEALMFAELNIENSTFDGTVPEEKLVALGQQRQLEQVDLRILAASYLSSGQQNTEIQNATLNLMPKDLINLANRLQHQYQQGKRFARWSTPAEQDETTTSDLVARQACICQNADIVPVIQYPFDLAALVKNMQLYGVDLRACILQTEKDTLLAQSALS